MNKRDVSGVKSLVYVRCLLLIDIVIFRGFVIMYFLILGFLNLSFLQILLLPVGLSFLYGIKFCCLLHGFFSELDENLVVV